MAVGVSTLTFLGTMVLLSASAAQERKLEKIRVGGGSVGAPQMTMWFAKEAGFYEKHGLAVEAISIPGSSMRNLAVRKSATLEADRDPLRVSGSAARHCAATKREDRACDRARDDLIVDRALLGREFSCVDIWQVSHDVIS